MKVDNPVITGRLAQSIFLAKAVPTHVPKASKSNFDVNQGLARRPHTENPGSNPSLSVRHNPPDGRK